MLKRRKEVTSYIAGLAITVRLVLMEEKCLCTGVRIFYSLPCRLTSLMKEKIKFEVELQWFIMQWISLSSVLDGVMDWTYTWRLYAKYFWYFCIVLVVYIAWFCDLFHMRWSLWQNYGSVECLVELHLSGPPIIRIGLALRVNL